MATNAGGRNPDEGGTRLAIDGSIATLTLDRPARRNALSMAVRLDLRAGLQEAMANPAVRVVVLAGAGADFCAGGDLGSMRGVTPWAFRERLGILHDVVRLMVGGPKPVIAAVEGNASGGGFSLAVAADLIVAGAGAQFSASFARVGLAPDLGLAYLLPRRIGAGPARRLLFTADAIGAEAALSLGLVDEVAPTGGALQAATALATRMTALAPTSLAATKRLLAHAPADLAGALELEAQAQSLLFATEDFQEGVAAFVEKRPAAFQGR